MCSTCWTRSTVTRGTSGRTHELDRLESFLVILLMLLFHCHSNCLCFVHCVWFRVCFYTGELLLHLYTCVVQVLFIIVHHIGTKKKTACTEKSGKGNWKGYIYTGELLLHLYTCVVQVYIYYCTSYWNCFAEIVVYNMPELKIYMQEEKNIQKMYRVENWKGCCMYVENKCYSVEYWIVRGMKRSLVYS